MPYSLLQILTVFVILIIIRVLDKREMKDVSEYFRTVFVSLGVFGLFALADGSWN